MRQVAPVTESADLVVVHGDTNTTLAGALLANKQSRRLAHVEAGVRSYDRSMPEEVNRTLADHLSDLLFVPTQRDRQNLERENVTKGVHVVGNTVIDALIRHLPLAEKRSDALARFSLKPHDYLLLTFHRAQNVDGKVAIERALGAFEAVAKSIGFPILFPLHPRTREALKRHGLEGRAQAIEGLHIVDPVGYLDALVLEKNAALVLTDSGGLQEESCFLRVPCVTLRENTELPETIESGASVLAGTDPERVVAAVRRQLESKRDWPNPYGAGTTARLIATIVNQALG